MGSKASQENPELSKLFGDPLIFSQPIQPPQAGVNTPRIRCVIKKIYHPPLYPGSGWCSFSTTSGEHVSGILPTFAVDMEVDAYCETKRHKKSLQYVIRKPISLKRCQVTKIFLSRALREIKHYADMEADSGASQLYDTFLKVAQFSEEAASKFVADFASKQPELFEYFSKRNLFTGQDRNLVMTYYRHRARKPEFTKTLSNLSSQDFFKCSTELKTNGFGCFFEHMTVCASVLGELKPTSKNMAVTQLFSSLSDQERKLVKFYHEHIKPRAKKHGHTCMTRDFVLHLMSQEDLDQMIAKKILNPKPSGNPNFPLVYFGPKSYEHGSIIGSSISRLIKIPPKEPPPPESYKIAGLGHDQTETLVKSFSQPFMMITGKPGTGKSFLLYSINKVHRYLRKSNKKTPNSYEAHRYLILTPNGMAARRLQKLGIEAHTISMIGKSCQNETYRTKIHDRYDSLIIDEGSQVSEEHLCMALSIFSDHPNFKQLLIFGDEDQQRPIGYGEPFRQLLSKFPDMVSNLVENHRVDEKSLYLLELFEKVLKKDLPGTLECLPLGSEFSDKPCLLLQCHPSEWQQEIKRIKQHMLDKGCSTVQILAHTNLMCSRITEALGVDEDLIHPGSFIKFCKNTYSKDISYDRISDEVCNGQSGTIVKILSYRSDLKKHPIPSKSRKNLPRNPSPEQALIHKHPHLVILGELPYFSLVAHKKPTSPSHQNVGVLLDSGEFVDLDAVGLDNVKHALAITGDSAEGSEFDGVIMLLDADHSLSDFYTLRHLYTQMTRTRTFLAVVTCSGVDSILGIFSNPLNDEKRFCNLITFIDNHVPDESH